MENLRESSFDSRMSLFWTEYFKLMTPYIYTFIPIFVAIDVIGLLPIYAGLTVSVPRQRHRKIAIQSIVTAFIISIAFLFVGKTVFKLLGITVADFQIAGGALLFIFALVDLVGEEKPSGEPSSHMGIVPLGTPIIIGPAVLTVLILMLDLYGIWPTMASLLINLGIVAIGLLNARNILTLLGEGGAKAVAKIVFLFLAAIGVMMMRRGILTVIMEARSALEG